MPESDTPEAKHEQSETFQDQSGRWQNYYGGVPGMGLRIPLEQGTSYGTSGEADAAAQIRSDMFPPQLEPREAPAPPAAPAPSSDFKSLAERLTGMIPEPPSLEERNAARIAASEARERAATSAADFAKVQGAEIDSTKKAAQAFADEAAGRAPQAPQISAPPSKGLRPFLAPSDADPPEKSIGKLMQAVSLFAAMIGGGRAGARASLSAMTGALEGWRAGDRERGDRAYADWKAQTDAMLKNWEVELTGYETWLRAAGLPIEQRMAGLRLEAMKRGNVALAEKFTADNAAAAFKELEDRQAQAIQVATDFAKIQAMREEKDRQNELKLLQIQQTGEWRQGLLRQRDEKQAEAKAKIDDAVEQYRSNPEMLKTLGLQWAFDPNGKMPIGSPRGPAGEQIRPMIVQAGIQALKERGIDPNSLPSIRQELAANKAALIDIRKQNTRQEGMAKRLDGHLDALVELSGKVPRGEILAVNEAIIKGQREFQGSEAAAAYVLQSFETSMELARLVVGAGAQGDAATRDEARHNLAYALANNQIKAIVGQIRQNAHRNLEKNRETERGLMAGTEAIQGAPGAPQPQRPAETSGGRAASRADVDSALKDAGGDKAKARALLISRGFDPAKEVTGANR